MTNWWWAVTKWCVRPTTTTAGPGGRRKDAAVRGALARPGEDYFASTTMVLTDAVAPSAISTSTM
jgi:hypothetical protein